MSFGGSHGALRVAYEDRTGVLTWHVETIVVSRRAEGGFRISSLEDVPMPFTPIEALEQVDRFLESDLAVRFGPLTVAGDPYPLSRYGYAVPVQKPDGRPMILRVDRYADGSLAVSLPPEVEP